MIRPRLQSVAIFAGVFATYVLASWISGTLSALPEQGDGPGYDNLAFNIRAGHGFGFGSDDPEWRAPYLNHPEYREVLEPRSSFVPTTYRSPAMPVLLAGVYAVTGRSFAGWRVVSCALMAATVTIAAAIAARFAGTIAAVLAALLGVANPQLLYHSHAFLTETLAAFLVAVLAWTLLNNMKRGWPAGGVVLVGLVLGLLAATRGIFVLWMPIALVIPGIRRKALCVLASLIVIAPWWIRNVAVTGAFVPLGTQGQIALTSAYGPRALQARGVWIPGDEAGLQELAGERLDPLTYEVRLAEVRTRLAWQWMREHPVDVLRLMLLHVWQEIRPYGRPLLDWLLPAAAVAAFLFRASAEARVLIGLVALNLLGIALTWSVRGRFMVPVQPMLISLVGAMAAVLARALTAARARS